MRIGRWIGLWLLALFWIGNAAASDDAKTTAIFAGGCFWCVESDFDRVDGVLETVSGFTGGTVENPTYLQVVRKGTGHREAVRITFDPSKVTYEALISAYWRSVDPTDAGGQFCDRGEPYQTAVFVLDEQQREIAERTKAEAQKILGREIATTIETASAFYPAEDYHQDYHNKNPLKYSLYRWRCGRDKRVEQVWGDAAYSGIPTH